MRNSISPVPWFYCSPILRMAAVACSHSLSKRLKLTLLQQGDPVFSTGTGEAMIFTLLQQGGRPKAHGAGECLDLTLLQQGAESRFSQSCDPMAQKHTNR